MWRSTPSARPCRTNGAYLHAIAAYRLPIPVFVARAVVRPLAWWILHQDNMILRRQADNVKRFGGEQFVNTPIDLLGTHIVRLLRRHERSEVAPFEPCRGRTRRAHDVDVDAPAWCQNSGCR